MAAPTNIHAQTFLRLTAWVFLFGWGLHVIDHLRRECLRRRGSMGQNEPLPDSAFHQTITPLQPYSKQAEHIQIVAAFAQHGPSPLRGSGAAALPWALELKPDPRRNTAESNMEGYQYLMRGALNIKTCSTPPPVNAAATGTRVTLLPSSMTAYVL